MSSTNDVPDGSGTNFAYLSMSQGPSLGLRNRMKTILLVEDNEDLRDLVSMALRSDGYRVYEAENGRDALQQLETMRGLPCLLLLDLMMPVMTGLELLQVLSERGALASLPVVVLSAGGQPSQAAGAQKFIRKPADLKLVLNAVHELCGSP